MVWTLNIQPLDLDSVTRSPLYSIYGETITGVTIIRSFGALTKFLRDMLRCVDTVRHSIPFTYKFICSNTGQNASPFYWSAGGMYTANSNSVLEYSVDSSSFVVNRWLKVCFNLLSAALSFEARLKQRWPPLWRPFMALTADEANMWLRRTGRLLRDWKKIWGLFMRYVFPYFC